MIFPVTSRKPVLLVGNGARTAGAIDLINDFAQKHSIPVLTTMNAADAVQGSTRIGFIGTHGNRVSNMIVNECDLIIAIGARLGIRQIGSNPEKFAPKAKLIRADIDQYELSRDIKVGEVKHLTDAKAFIEVLASEDVPTYEDWMKACLEARDCLSGFDKTAGNYAVEKIASMLPDNALVSVDVGQNQCWCAQSLRLRGGKGRMLIAGGYGAMGCALPFAIGSSVSIDDGIVYCITGDGGLQMNIQELEVLNREQLPVKILVLNNKVLGKISETQYGSYNRRFAQTTESSGYSVPSFERIAKAYNLRAATLESFEELDEYEEWLHDDEPCLLDIMIPRESFLTPKINFKTGDINPPLDPEVVRQAKQILAIEL